MPSGPPRVAVDAAILERVDELAARWREAASEVDRSARFPAEHVDAIRAAGLFGLAVPPAMGGAGVGLAGACEVLRRVARGDGGTALGLAMHLVVTGSVAAGGEEWPAAVWERVARAAARGEVILNRVASEAQGGSPARGGMPRTVLVAGHGGWVLTGRKDWATWAPALTHALVTARIDGGGGGGMRLAQALVPLGLPGVSRLEARGAIGLRSAANGSLVFDGVRLARDAVLWERAAGEQGSGRNPLVLAWFRLCTTAVYVGIAEAARDAVALYTRGRRPNDRAEPISAIPAVQLRLGRMASDSRAAWLLVRSAAEGVDAEGGGEEDSAEEVAVAKVHATRLAWAVCEQALRLAGGGALQGDGLPLERLARDARGGLVHPPTEDTLHLELGGGLASV